MAANKIAFKWEVQSEILYPRGKITTEATCQGNPVSQLVGPTVEHFYHFNLFEVRFQCMDTFRDLNSLVSSDRSKGDTLKSQSIFSLRCAIPLFGGKYNDT